jgi:Set1/Ash2 histone methyltransferase complex subunit ASH2
MSETSQLPEASKRAGPDIDADVIQKKKKKGSGANVQADEVVEAKPQDYVRIIPLRKQAQDDGPAGTVLLSKTDKAAQMQLGEDRLSVTGGKGYRTIRATHGMYEGSFYCEVKVTRLGDTGHCRLGWSSKKSEINAPVGFDAHGFSYRDLEGSKVHKALREPYGEAYAEGDVIGLMLYMPPGGRPMERRMSEIVRYKGSLYHVDEGEEPPKPLVGSRVAFSKNGVYQGVAYEDVLEGTYYPSASLHTLPHQIEGAMVTFNFGPMFSFPIPEVEQFPGLRPYSDLPNWLADVQAVPQPTAAGQSEQQQQQPPNGSGA